MSIIKANEELELYIDQLMDIEQNYNPKLRKTADEKRELYTSPNSLILLWLKEQKVLGERSGLSIKDIDEEELIALIPNYTQYCASNALYVHSFTVRPEYRGQGLGKELALAFIKKAKEMGYSRIIGHAREGASKHINEIFGSTIIKSFENWYETREIYYFHDLVLM